MASKICVSVILLVLSSLVVCKGTAAASDGVVMDEREEEVRYGQDHSFLLISNEGEDKVRFASGPFHFGLGFGGLPVRTGTQVTLAMNDRLMACKNGKVEWVEQNASTSPPQEALLRVLPFDTAQNLYILEITETPGVFLSDSQLSSCILGGQATPFNFRNIAPIASVAQG